MGKYLGRDVAYGLYEKQSFVPDGVANSFTLKYQAGSVGSLLVNYAGAILEPGADYALDAGGTKIVFSFIPQIGYPLYLIYMGKELQIPVSAGNYPVHYATIANGVQTEFILPLSPLTAAALMVFKEGILQRYLDHWTILGNTVTFLTAPPVGQHLDFYIHGIERTDINTVDPYAITSLQIAPGAVTSDKIYLEYLPFPSTPTVETFGNMDATNLIVHQAKYYVTGQIVQVRLCFSVDLVGGENLVRVSLPVPNNGNSNLTGVVTIVTDSYFENGIIRWGDTNSIDLYRAFGLNYLNETVVFMVQMEYEKGT